MIKPNSNKLREMLNNLGDTDSEVIEGPSTQDVILCSMKWTRDDIVHYLQTETDHRRLARWCQMYLDLPY